MMLARFVSLALALSALAVTVAPVTVAGQAYRQQGVSPIFDGWEELPDGTRLFYFGYINRGPEVAVPLGPDNTFEPGPADRGQPTILLPGRHEHVFTVPVTAKFTGKLVWTLKLAVGTQHTANASFDQLYMLEQRENADPNAKPPIVKIAETAAKVGQPVQLNPAATPALNSGRVEVEGAAAEAAGLNLTWSKYRGPGAVTFAAVPGAAAAAPPVTSGRGRGAAEPPIPGVHRIACGAKPVAGCGAVIARFNEPGTYTLRLEARQDGLQGLTFAKVTVTQ
jgi:hypothetical protein